MSDTEPRIEAAEPSVPPLDTTRFDRFARVAYLAYLRSWMHPSHIPSDAWEVLPDDHRGAWLAAAQAIFIEHARRP